MLGFACKINTSTDTPDPKLNIKGTTLTWLRNNPQKAIKKLEDLLQYNIACLAKQIEFVGSLPKAQRMFRISSDLLPAYTTEEYMPFYFSDSITLYLYKELSKIGDRARELGIRLSFHPGQFCVLASDSQEIIENSILEFEYHADIIRYLGFGKTFQDFKCNIHIGGRGGPSALRKTWSRLSKVARNTITVENQEFTWGLESCLELGDLMPVVLDLHHYWINTGNYLTNQETFLKVFDTWRGVTPTLHFSQSLALEPLQVQHNAECFSTNTKQKLRAHSQYYFDHQLNDYLWDIYSKYKVDIMLEAKEKNLAQAKLVDEWVEKYGFDPHC